MPAARASASTSVARAGSSGRWEAEASEGRPYTTRRPVGGAEEEEEEEEEEWGGGLPFWAQ